MRIVYIAPIDIGIRSKAIQSQRLSFFLISPWLSLLVDSGVVGQLYRPNPAMKTFLIVYTIQYSTVQSNVTYHSPVTCCLISRRPSNTFIQRVFFWDRHNCRTSTRSVQYPAPAFICEYLVLLSLSPFVLLLLLFSYLLYI